VGLALGALRVGPLGKGPRSLEIVVPGLFGPVPIRPEEIPDVPVLSRLLSHGTRRQLGGGGFGESLLAAFGLGEDGRRPQDVPSAPICHLADAGAGDPSGSGYWLHADPVHLRLERDRLLLYDARQLDLRRDEADALVACFNDHFAADGRRLEAPVPGRWYLQLDRAPRLRTEPLEAVIGRNVAPFLPRGEEAHRWVGLMNEAQMLFARAESNRRRVAEGRLPVSGIWPWGGGDLAQLPRVSRSGSVFADHPLALGLARLADIRAHPLAEVGRGFEDALAQEAILVVWDRLWPAVLDAAPMTWVREIVDLETWLRQVEAVLAGGQLCEIRLDGCQGQTWQTGPLARWRLWRRSRPFRQLVSAA